MLCYLTDMEPYYITCIKDDPFQPKTVEGANKLEVQWTPDERRVVNQDQRLKIIIISCLHDDIIDLVISYETAKANGTDLDEEEVCDDEEMVQVKVLLVLAYDELVVWEKHASNGYWNWTSPYRKLTKASSKNDVNENAFIYASMGYDHEMIPKSKYWVERYNPDSKLPNFNIKRILVPKSKAVNERLGITQAPIAIESFKESGLETQTPLPTLKILQGASPRSKVMLFTYSEHSPWERPGLGSVKHTKPDTQCSSVRMLSGMSYCTRNTDPIITSVPTKVKNNEQESKINELTKLVQMLMDEKINSSQKI
ncbi:hypothetical protein Tco_1287841 [Tanacetum coccineum]